MEKAKYRRRAYVAKLKGRVLENTMEKTKQEVRERVVELHSKRDMHDRTVKPSWTELAENGYSVTTLRIEEI